MTFGDPSVLLGLAAVPILAGWYLSRQRDRGRRQQAFAATVVAASVAPHRPGWRRHAPLLAFLVAIAALIVALADPRTTHAASVGSTAIMLACDVSGSMGATDVAPTRLAAAQRAARRFIDAMPAGVRVGVMVFDQAPQILQAPTTDRAADRRALSGWRPHGGTAIGTAIEAALATLSHYGGGSASHPSAAIVLLSDGGSDTGVAPLTAARAAAARHVPVDTVALGTPGGRIKVTVDGRTITVAVPPQPALLASIAKTAGGETFAVQDAGRLDAVYRGLAAKLTRRRVTRTLEAGFAGAALALLAIGTALSLRWFGRLI
jgi:Ca-activated chloride channel family protein